MIGNGAVMGFAPSQIGAMSLWEYAACVDGFNRAHGGKQRPPPPSDEEFEAMKRAHGDA